MNKHHLKALAALCGLVFGMAGAAPALADAYLIRDVRLFDGQSMLAGRSVLIADGKIADADFHGATPAGTIEIAGAGRTLLPGLIDAHVHAYRYLDLPPLFGVTTQIDMFTGVAVLQDVTRKMAQGRNGGQADLFSAGTLATAPGGHGTEYGMPIPTLTRPEQAQAFVDARIAEGSHFIKIVLESGYSGHPMPSLDIATVKALVDAAHRRGKLAVVHISTLADARAALEAGADGLAHLFVGAAISATDLATFVELARDKKAFVIPTFCVMESIAGLHADEIIGDPAMRALLDKEQLQTLKTSYGGSPRAELMTAPRAVVAALRLAHVPILAGTDAGNQGTQYGASLHHEMLALTRAGLTPDEALAAATSVPAKVFGLPGRGMIAAGYKADLLLVEGDPERDITSTRRIVEVWKDGAPVAAARARQQARVAAELRPGAAPRLPADGRISLFSKDKLAGPFGLGWSPSNDAFLGGKSSAQLAVQGPGADGQMALEVRAAVAPGFAFPWAGVAFMPGAQPMQPVDLSAAKVLKFRVKGDGRRYDVALLAAGVMVPVRVGFDSGPDWREVSMPLSAFKGIDTGALTMIAFLAGPAPGDYTFQIADVRLLGE